MAGRPSRGGRGAHDRRAQNAKETRKNGAQLRGIDNSRHALQERAAQLAAQRFFKPLSRKTARNQLHALKVLQEFLNESGNDAK